MTGITIELDKDSLVNVLDALNNLSAAAEDLTPVWDDMGAYFASELEQHFQDSTAWDGTPWVPSQRALEVPAYKDRKNKKFFQGGNTLIDQGHLKDSFTWDPDANGFEFGTDSDYGGIHQFGGETGRNHAVTMPARPMLPDALTPGDEEEILTIINLHLERAMTK